MSEGPIKREREATTVPRVSIPNTQRICLSTPLGQRNLRAWCGRKGTQHATEIAGATCPECLAALRADAPLPAPLETP